MVLLNDQFPNRLLSLMVKHIHDGMGWRRYHLFRSQYGMGVKCVLRQGGCSHMIQRSANGWAYCVNLQACGLPQVKERDVSLLYAIRSVEGIYANI